MNSLSTLHVWFLGEKLKPWPCYRKYDNASSYDFPAKTTVSVEVVNIPRYTLRENVPL